MGEVHRQRSWHLFSWSARLGRLATCSFLHATARPSHTICSCCKFRHRTLTETYNSAKRSCLTQANLKVMFIFSVEKQEIQHIQRSNWVTVLHDSRRLVCNDISKSLCFTLMLAPKRPQKTVWWFMSLKKNPGRKYWGRFSGATLMHAYIIYKFNKFNYHFHCVFKMKTSTKPP